MFKRIKPNVVPIQILGAIPHPHCNQRVLHAPGECQHCDKHPVWQALRQLWGIAFTGYEPENNELPDPATAACSLKTIDAWPGNKAHQIEEKKS